MPATGQSTNAITFSFDGKNPLPDEASLRAAVTAGGAVEETADTAPPAVAAAAAAPATDDLTAKPAADQPSLDTPVTDDLTAKPATDEVKTYKITVEGQELEVTEADLKAGHMRLRDYTQKTQKVAERERALTAKEKAWEAERAQLQAELQAIDQFLRSPQAVDAYRQKAFGAAQGSIPPPQIDPNKPPTMAEVAEIARYNAEQVRLATLRDVEARTAEARAAAEQVGKKIELEKLETAVDSYIGTLLDKYPVLKKFEGIEDDLIGDASRFKPRSLDEARARLSEAAERRVAVIRAYAEEEKKAAAVAAAKLQKTSPEKPGGTPAKPAPGKKLTFDHKDRNARIDAGVETVQAYLNSLT